MKTRPVIATLAVLLITMLSVAGCVSMPAAGPVQSYPMTQASSAQNQTYVQLQPQPPGPGWNPQQIVEGFLAASASFGNYAQVAQQYLTPGEQQNWKANWSALVYKTGPYVESPKYPSAAKDSTTATVHIKGSIQASLTGNDNYSAVPSASSQGGVSYSPAPFQLQKVQGQWRISSAPQELLLTSNSFMNDYQLRNLYFFDPAGRFLVPDPVYVPLEATPGTPLMNGLVRDLIAPPHDWLSEGATKTAFPAGTKLSSVEFNGATAVVNLTGTTIAKADGLTKQEILAQLLWTLRGAVQGGQAVQSVEVQVNGKSWTSDPVQQPSKYQPAAGASPKYYYVDSAGYLTSRSGGRSDRLAKIGTGYSQIAVSRDGHYVAALRGTSLYAGIIGKPLVRQGSGYLSMSWDVNDDLWASTNTQIVMFRSAADARQPLGQKVPVTVVPNSNPIELPYTDIKVAPDGVRVAIVMDSSYLTFGAVSGLQGPNPQISLSTVQYSAAPPSQSDAATASFTALSWYGPDKVVALSTPGPVVTEYPVSGGTPTPIPADPSMQTVAASSGEPLIAGLPAGQMASDASPAGSWMPVTDKNDVPAHGSAPTYPG